MQFYKYFFNINYFLLILEINYLFLIQKFKMTQENNKCLICCSKLSTTKSIYSENSESSSKSSLLSKNLDVIFVLRRILKVPIVGLVHQLKKSGSDPRSWIRLCDQCSQLNRNAKGLDRTELRCVRKEVVEKMTSSRSSQQDYDALMRKVHHDKKSLTFEDKIRSFVKTYNYNDNSDDNEEDHNGRGGGDEFLEGDKLAKYLVESRQSPSPSKTLLVEVEETVNANIKFEVECPPSPPSLPPSPLGGMEMTPPNSPEPFVNDAHDVEDVDISITRKRKGKNKTKTEPKKRKRKATRSYKPSEDEDEEEAVEEKIPKRTKVKRKIKSRPEKRDLNCPHCGKKYQTPQSLDYHVRFVHLKNFKITCPICGRGLCNNQQKARHMLTTHKNDPVTIKLQEEEGLFFKRCSMMGCLGTFFKEGDEEKHMEKLHGGGGGDAKVGSEETLSTKCKIKADGQVFCGECGKWYFNWSKWTRHVWKNHEGEDLNCPGEECERIFKVSSDTLEEFKGHWGESHEGKLTCNICGEEMENREMLRKHKSNKHYTNRKEGPWLCDICGEEKVSYAMLHYHRKTVHRVDTKGDPLNLEEWKAAKTSRKKKVLCNLCGKELSEQYKLKLHLKNVHEREFSFSCHVCGEGKPSKRELHVHLFRKHKEDPLTRQLEEEEGLRLLRCEIVGCTSVFLREEELEGHAERMHKMKGGVRAQHERFRCEICGKGFFLMTKLRSHKKRVHEKVKGRSNGKPLNSTTIKWEGS